MEGDVRAVAGALQSPARAQEFWLSLTTGTEQFETEVQEPILAPAGEAHLHMAPAQAHDEGLHGAPGQHLDGAPQLALAVQEVAWSVGARGQELHEAPRQEGGVRIDLDGPVVPPEAAVDEDPAPNLQEHVRIEKAPESPPCWTFEGASYQRRRDAPCRQRRAGPREQPRGRDVAEDLPLVATSEGRQGKAEEGGWRRGLCPWGPASSRC
mmetsp:Transcript_88659/g.275632  ORF Transcript_88659/g.275632 Transcript_88659/m.275632 type:complete len:210 (+) Transcript_88659:48-677(+)